MKISHQGIGAVLLFAASIAFGADLAKAPVTFRSGNWKVLRTLDAMDDKVHCTGIYKEDYSIQLTDHSMYVSIRGGLESVTMRFDDKPAQSNRIAQRAEKEIDAIVIDGANFEALKNSSRLRIQALTLVRGIEEKDFDLTGITEAVQHIQSGCPLPASSPLSSTKQNSDSSCTVSLISKMKAQGLAPDKIAAICSPN